MGISIKHTQRLRPLVAACFVLQLQGCGGGGVSDGSSAMEATLAAPQQFALAQQHLNAITHAAGTAMLIGLQAGALGLQLATPNAPRSEHLTLQLSEVSWLGDVIRRSVLSMRPASMAKTEFIPCTSAGKATLEVHQIRPFELSPGDRFNLELMDCGFQPGSSLNGRITFEVTEALGKLSESTQWAAQVVITVDQLKASASAHQRSDFSMSAKLALNVDSVLGSPPALTTVPHAEVPIDGGPETGLGIKATMGSLRQGGDPAQQVTLRFSGRVSSPGSTASAWSVRTIGPFNSAIGDAQGARIQGGFPHTGQALIEYASRHRVQVVALNDGQTAHIGVDEDGDGNEEFVLQRPWRALGP